MKVMDNLMNILLNIWVWGSLIGIMRYGHYMNWKTSLPDRLKLLGLLFVWIVVIVLLYQFFPDFAIYHREG
jgi:hypothetical protein